MKGVGRPNPGAYYFADKVYFVVTSPYTLRNVSSQSLHGRPCFVIFDRDFTVIVFKAISTFPPRQIPRRARLGTTHSHHDELVKDVSLVDSQELQWAVVRKQIQSKWAKQPNKGPLGASSAQF